MDGSLNPHRRFAPQYRASLGYVGWGGGTSRFRPASVALNLPQPNSPQYFRWIAVEATGLAIEVALWMLSISLIWGLQMKIQKRVLILNAFGCRLMYIPLPLLSPSRKLTQPLRLIPIVAIRLFYLYPSENYDPTLTSILPHILTEGALAYAIISTSITALKPFLKPFHSGAIMNTVGGGGSRLNSGSRSGAQGIYMLNSIATDKDNGQTTTTTVHSENGNTGPQPQFKFYTGNSEGTAAVSSRGDAHQDDIDSLDSNSSKQTIIQTTKEWRVRYENS
jgi:hypothetical protein